MVPHFFLQQKCTYKWSSAIAARDRRHALLLRNCGEGELYPKRWAYQAAASAIPEDGKMKTHLSSQTCHAPVMPVSPQQPKSGKIHLATGEMS